MGLQVVVITEIKFLSKEDKPQYAYKNVEWLYQIENSSLTVTEGFYEYKYRKRFINNISHYYYNMHRETLSRIIGWKSVNNICGHPKKYGIPFIDIMYFSCIEGSFDWHPCSRLNYEFEIWFDKVLQTKNKKFIKWYEQMMTAYKYAADTNGAVLFV